MSSYPSPDGDLMVMMFADGSHLRIGADDKAPHPDCGCDPEGPPRVGYNGCCLTDCDCDPNYEAPAVEHSHDEYSCIVCDGLRDLADMSEF